MNITQSAPRHRTIDSVRITCSTNRELVLMYARVTFTQYYKSMILQEMENRGMVGKW